MRIHFHLFNLLSQLLPGRFHLVRAIALRLCGAQIGKDVRVNGCVKAYSAYVEMGDGVWVSSEVAFFTGPDAWVRIGSRCDIGHGAWFVTGSHRISGPERRAGEGWSREISVGNGCWIGARATILGGAKIGSGSVVGAGSVVLPGEYPANVLLAGAPATVRRVLAIGEDPSTVEHSRG